MAELEARLAFQDDALQTMSEELHQQQRAIERLQLQLAELARRQREMAEAPEAGTEPPPPHY